MILVGTMFLCIENVLRKARCWQYPSEAITAADYTDDLVTNTPTQAKSLLHSLEQATKGIGLSEFR